MYYTFAFTVYNHIRFIFASMGRISWFTQHIFTQLSSNFVKINSLMPVERFTFCIINQILFTGYCKNNEKYLFLRYSGVIDIYYIMYAITQNILLFPFSKLNVQGNVVSKSSINCLFENVGTYCTCIISTKLLPSYFCM